MTDHSRVSKDIGYSLFNLAQKGLIGNEVATGTLGKYSRNYVESAIVVPYHCSDEEQKSVCEALRHRLVLFSEDGDDVAHPHIKFLANYIALSIKRMDFSGKSVKVVGPKFDKEEVECFKTAKSIHYCTKRPITDDVARELSSSRSLEKKIKKLEMYIDNLDIEITCLKETFRKNPCSGYSKGASSEIKEKLSEKVDLEFERVTLLEQKDVISSLDSKETLVCCNVGAETCSVKADKLIAFDSIYDIDLQKLIKNANDLGVDEIFATVILPFGLLFVKSYYSAELNVQFRKEGKGFMMIHGKDMSNGYVHEKAETVMQLMKSSFVHPDVKNYEKFLDGTWSYEIVNNVAEICLLRFTKANKSHRIVRKLMPTKFDDFSIIYDPVKYFSPIREIEPIMVPTSKLEFAVSMVLRNKSPKTIIEDLYAYVQCMFMRVSVGNTELQRGASLDSQLEDSLVLYALIEGGSRKHNLGNAFKKALKKRGIFGTIFSSWCEFMKEGFYDIMPGIIDYFTKSRCEKYIKERIDLKNLYLDSDKNDISLLTFHFNNILDGCKDVINEFYDSAPTLSELVEMKGGNPEAYYHRILEAQNRFANCTFAAGYRRKYEEKVLTKHFEFVEQEEEKFVYKNLLRFQLGEEIAEIEEEEESYSFMYNYFSIKPEDRYIEDDDGRKVLKPNNFEQLDDKGFQNMSDREIESIGLPYESHTPDSSDHKILKMDDLTKALFSFNMHRIKDGSLGKGYSKKVLAKLIDKFTKMGEECKCIISVEQAKKALESLSHEYKIDASTEYRKVLLKLKSSVLKLVKENIRKKKYENIKDKNLFVIKGVAGSGKTTYIANNFDPVQDSYVSPFCGVLFELNEELKKKHGDLDFNLKTYEKISDLKSSGRTLYIDEASSMNLPYLIFLITQFDFQKYVIVGDDEQTKYFDTTGMMGNDDFTTLVPYDKITIFYFSFRYGPTVAAYLNSAFNYPVISLKSTDTTLVYEDIDTFDENTDGTNIAITEDTVDYYLKRGVSNFKTAKSCQGQGFKRVNFINRVDDAQAAVAFRSNGIVAASRCKEELHVFIDIKSKATKAMKNLTVMMDNYATMFNVVLPHESDF